MRFHAKSGLAKAAPFGAIAAIVMIGSFLVSRSLTIRQVARAASEIIPFTLETEIHHQGANPAEEILVRRIVARRSDGAQASVGPVMLGPAGIKAGAKARRVSLMDGSEVTLDDATKAKTTWPKRTTDAMAALKHHLTNPPQSCIFNATETLLGYDMVLDQQTAIVRKKPIPTSEGQNVTDTIWRALGLSCQILRYQVEMEEPDGSQQLVTEGKAVSLKFGEPDSALFDTGANYAEMKPSELLRLKAQRLGIAWNPSEVEQTQDAIYLGLPTLSKGSRTLPKAPSGR